MTAHVQAKFFVQEVKHIHTGDPNATCAVIVMQPVYADSEENKTWSRYTPSGKLEMTVTNPKAVEAFGVGNKFYLDFTPAD